ncbi:zinc carboxypeptidase [Balneolaceae bacterium YR4-1]|uniref:Zinc carboxypeptidase n=1 Tax=Halalkalibaculum roseum TaxID=2709311 RepID=A0A6M1SQN5_9BACT|nr:M14 family metallopeptidase [Halalkalibaculum roseum]NGP77409.1 zinc carboxypeptidase [Halalkalibaculum roseum]
MKNLKIGLSFLVILLFFISPHIHAQDNLQSPEQYLGYELGSKWTPHYKVMNYFRYVSEQSPMVTFEQYGTTNEGRELVIVKVASEENHGRLEQIRMDNLKRAGLLDGDPATNIPIVWLSYNVHGNETSSSEAALKTLYELVRPGNATSKQWLSNTVVIMDPMINPDGRDRYVNWYTQVVGDEFNAYGDAREHHEPWPGGRTNHYYFDLNRDWAWLTQKESRQRVELYQQWMPQIHVDYHEQSYTSPYYFAPAAEPFHKAITDWQREFQYTIGRNHARYFDSNSWLYFTREVFDLFYPSYGDTYPIFNGSIGMTYEQAGGGYAGLGIIKPEGDTLTLNDRLTHHYTTGMSTVEIASQNAEKLVGEFAEYYDSALENPTGEYKSFVIKAGNNPDKMKALFDLLNKHNIEYGKAARSRNLNGYNYNTGTTERVSVSENDYVVSAFQPKSVLARVLFEPRPQLADSLTYDITTWEQHYAYGLDGYALQERIAVNQAPAPVKNVNNRVDGSPYAYLAEWKDLADLQMLSELLQNDIKLRYAEEAFAIDGISYDPGTLIITRNGNTQMGSEFDSKVQEIATRHGQQLNPVSTGFVSSGSDFGASSVEYLKAPRVALLSGEGTSSYMVGEIWHYFDRQIDYPVTLINVEDLGSISLHEYDVLIMPDGYYNDELNGPRMNEIKEWITSGGRLIAVEGANGMLAGKEGFSLKRKDADNNDEEGNDDEEEMLERYGESQRESISSSNSGSIFKLTMDNSHPLAFGYGDTYFTLKRNADAYSYLDSGWNVGVAKENAHMSGFVGYMAKEKLENTLTFGVQNMGRGSVVYIIDNPLFRAFWYNGKLLFGNAVFFN